MKRNLTNTPPQLLLSTMKKDGKKAYIKPSMWVYPLCDKI